MAYIKHEVPQFDFLLYLLIASESCFDMTVATSIGLPGLTRGEQIGGMMNSTAGKNNSAIQTDSREFMMAYIR